LRFFFNQANVNTMEKWRTLALVALAFTSGMIFVVACGNNASGGGVELPGVNPAFAQSGCDQWEFVEIDTLGLSAGSLTIGTDRAEVFTGPSGWTPLGRTSRYLSLVRCKE
jgi:hypothetical protein